MNNSDRVVTEIPLKYLWDMSNNIEAVRKQYLNKGNIKTILRTAEVDFVIADIGDKLKWVDANKCYNFWKSEIEAHLINDTEFIDIDNCPHNYAYIASEWVCNSGRAIILFEKIH